MRFCKPPPTVQYQIMSISDLHNHQSATVRVNETAKTEHYDTVIIGAGMSGLAAGIRLAHYDQSVCILERHWTIGGLNSFYRMNGRNYDVGLHALTNYTAKGTKKGPLARLLKQLRLRHEDFQLAPQTGSAIRFPACSCVSTTISNCCAVRLPNGSRLKLTTLRNCLRD